MIVINNKCKYNS